MVALGDALSPEKKLEFVRSRLVAGRIVRVNLNLRKGPKLKYFLVVHVGDEILGLIINSEINEFIRRSQHLHECQVIVDKASHDGLDYDSYIDCSVAHYERAEAVREQLVRDIGAIRDELSDAVRAKVIAALSDSFVLERSEKQRLIEGLHK